jgi:hypothetical protein
MERPAPGDMPRLFFFRTLSLGNLVLEILEALTG